MDIRSLKEYAVSDLKSRPTLRDTFLIEDDMLDEAEFIDKLDTWLKLFRVDGDTKSSSSSSSRSRVGSTPPSY